MANHEAVAALPVGSSTAKQLLRDMAVRRFPYALTAAGDATSLVAVDPASGAAIIDLLANGRVYHYDSTDTTTAHDGVTVLVSQEGRRYKLAAGSDVVAYSVLGNTATAPPGSPAISNAYLVASGATGAWSGHDGAVAVYTARGWEFVTVAVGRFIYVKAGSNINTYYHKNAAGAWVAGFGLQSLGANSVPVSAIINAGRTSFIVENQTTNTPPASPAVGVAYIVGSAPTGVWAAKAGQIAVCEVTGAWTYYVPSNGWQAFDKALNAPHSYIGSAWVSSAGAIIGEPQSIFTASGSTSSGGVGYYTYASGTAPTTAQVYVKDDAAAIVYTARKINARLRFFYQVHVGTTITHTLGLFRDAELSAVNWVNQPAVNTANTRLDTVFEIDANDATEHTYHIRLINNGGGAPSASITRRRFSIEEFA